MLSVSRIQLYLCALVGLAMLAPITAFNIPLLGSPNTVQSMAQKPNSKAPDPGAITPDRRAGTPTRLKFNLSLSSLNDLKVKLGDTVSVGQAIADRSPERSHLTKVRQALELSLQQIQQKAVVEPTSPVAVPSANELPPISYAEEEAAIANAKLAVQQATREYTSQQEKLKSAPLEESSAVRRAEVSVNEKQRAVDIERRKIDAVQGMKDLPPDVLVHEQEVLKQKESELKTVQADLQQAIAKEQSAAIAQSEKLQSLSVAIEKAQGELQLAISKLQTAKDKRAYTEYEASITSARRVEERNTAQQNYTRQLQEAEQHQRDREFQAAQVQSKIAEVDNQLATLSTVKSPYAGTIREVRIISQNDKNISVEVVLNVSGDSKSVPSHS